MAKKAKRPPYKDAERCIEIRKRSKAGRQVSEEESAFCAAMYQKYGAWYSETEKRVFNETLPFGSNVRIE